MTENQISDKRTKQYMVAETVFVIAVVLLSLEEIIITWCNIHIDALEILFFCTMAATALLIHNLLNNKVVTWVMIAYVLAMVCYFLLLQKESSLQNALLLVVNVGAAWMFYFLFKLKTIRIVSGIAMMGLMLTGYFMDVSFPRAVIAMVIFLFLYSVSEAVNVFSSANAGLLVLIYALVAVLTMLMPASEKPYDWGFVYRITEWTKQLVKNVAVELQYRFGDEGSGEMLAFRVTGYSEDGMNLFQRMVETDVEQLTLQGDYTRKQLYLRGNVYDEYTGSGWIRNEKKQEIDYRTDTLMTLYAIFDKTTDADELHRFMEIKEQKIILKNIKTQTLFYPLKIIDISEKEIVQRGDIACADKINARGYMYTYCFVDIDYSNEKVIEILKESKAITYEEEQYYRMYEHLEELFQVEIQPIPFTVFCDMAERVKESAYKYGVGECEFVSEKVENLTDKIAVGCQNTYEACKELETYLQGYRYNQSVHMTESENVLDTFLFEEKEGYCAHYATALTCMLRRLAIPARVADGYLVNYKEREDIYEYVVSSKRAHTWSEAYVDGFGWIPLEPTAAYAANTNKAWYSEQANVLEAEEESDDGNMPDKNSEFSNEEAFPLAEEKMQAEEAAEYRRKAEQIEYLLQMGKFMAGMVLCVCVAIGLFVFCKRAAIKRSTNPDVVFTYFLYKLEKRYFVKESAETIEEYFGRLCGERNVSAEEKEQFFVISRAMEAYWYGQKDVDAEIMNKMKTYTDERLQKKRRV